MLDYVALGILIIAALILFYGIIVIHDIPYEIAERRNHPHQDAIHVAGWVSLLTLHVIWPFLWIWATLYQKERGWGFRQKQAAPEENNQIEALRRRVDEQEKSIIALQLALKSLRDSSSLEGES